MTVLIKRTVSYLRMYSAESVILGSWLAARQPLAPKIVITIPAGNIIGGINGGPALLIDDLTDYSSVTIENYGEIQGQGGSANGGWGGNAVFAQGGTVTLNNYGYIRSGGSGGIKGGTGAWGNWVTGWGPQKFNSSSSSWYRYSAGCSDYKARYDGVYKGLICQQPYILNGSYMYTYGDSAPDPFGSFNYIKRSTIANGIGGTGGAGGRGKGYNQTNQNGTAGAYGTNSGGRGGTGGNGGWWGNSGGTSGTGSTGSYFKEGASAGDGGTRYSRATSYATVPGATFAPAGYSLIATDGGSIIFTNSGTVQGPKSGVA